MVLPSMVIIFKTKIIAFPDIMDLNYVLQTLLKILISTPGLLLICRLSGAYGAALLGNGSSRNFTDVSSPYYDYELSDSQELEQVSKPISNKA